MTLNLVSMHLSYLCLSWQTGWGPGLGPGALLWEGQASHGRQDGRGNGVECFDIIGKEIKSHSVMTQNAF